VLSHPAAITAASAAILSASLGGADSRISHGI